VSKEAGKFMVVMNAATAIITEKSPDMIRTSMTPRSSARYASRSRTRTSPPSCSAPRTSIRNAS
jgi:hypothetical protein